VENNSLKDKWALVLGSSSGFGEALDVPAGVFDNTLNVEDCNPLEVDARDEKVYVSGIGIAKDEAAELVSFEEEME